MLCKPVLLALSTALVLSGCSTPGSFPTLTPVSALSITELCSEHGSATHMFLLLTEAELGARGVMQCASANGTSSYLGEKTSATIGQSLYARSVQTSFPSDEKDCSDFASAAEAQKFFLLHGGPNKDPHALDGDGDGNACEWGKALKNNVAKYKPRSKAVSYSAPRQSSSPICHTGPRGGRYYYGAGGEKVYGC